MTPWREREADLFAAISGIGAMAPKILLKKRKEMRSLERLALKTNAISLQILPYFFITFIFSAIGR